MAERKLDVAGSSATVSEKPAALVMGGLCFLAHTLMPELSGKGA